MLLNNNTKVTIKNNDSFEYSTAMEAYERNSKHSFAMFRYYVKKVIKSCFFMRNIIFLIHSGFIKYSSLNIDKSL